MGAVLALGLSSYLAGGSPAGTAPQVFASALRPVFQIALALGVLGGAVSLMVPEKPLRRHFEPTPGRGSSLGADEAEVPDGVTIDEAERVAQE
jgi:hypothetical protein